VRGVRPVVGGRAPVVFAFDLGAPETYLAAERVERTFPGAIWQAVVPDVVPAVDEERVARRAEALDLPLTWPPERDAPALPAMRVSLLAAEQALAAPFVLAASRLAYAGGDDLDDLEVVVEAAGAAGLDLDETVDAAFDPRLDDVLMRASRLLVARGVRSLPCLLVGGRAFCGEEQVELAAMYAREHATV